MEHELHTPEHSEKRSPAIHIEDIHGAKEFIMECLERGDHPVVTVKKEHLDALKNGLYPHTTWLPTVEVISATLGRDPYLPTGEDRVQVEVVDIEPEQIEPRFTGEDHTFHGVVILKGPISPEHLHIIG